MTGLLCGASFATMLIDGGRMVEEALRRQQREIELWRPLRSRKGDEA